MAQEPSSTPPARLRTLAELPGPSALPLIGNRHQLDGARIHRTLEGWAATFGPYYRFRIGRRSILAVADPAAIRGILRDRPTGFYRTTLLEKLFRELGVAGVFSANGAAWRVQRRMVMAAFDARHVTNYFPFMTRVTERLRRRWTHHAERGIALDLQADLMRYTVDVVVGLAFGIDINTIESPGETIQTHLNHVFPMLNRRLAAPFPYWRWLRLPSDRALDRHLAELRRIVHSLIEAAHRRLIDEPALKAAPGNLVEAMIVASELPDSGVTDRDVASNAITMLLAGEDTTANTLAWLAYLASSDPQVTARLTDEADRQLGESRIAERLEVASSLVYTGACAHETMRLKPVAPIMFLEAARPTVVGGIEVPAGTVVGLLMRSGACDARYFPAPDAFKPERWLPGEASGARSSGGERWAMPFGSGPRICPGRNLALLEMSLVTSMLFRNFRIADLSTETGDAAEEWLAFTMSPSRLMLTLVPRRAA